MLEIEGGMQFFKPIDPGPSTSIWRKESYYNFFESSYVIPSAPRTLLFSSIKPSNISFLRLIFSSKHQYVFMKAIVPSSFPRKLNEHEFWFKFLSSWKYVLTPVLLFHDKEQIWTTHTQRTTSSGNSNLPPKYDPKLQTFRIQTILFLTLNQINI